MKTLNEATVVCERDRQILRGVKGVIQTSLPTADVLLYGSVARGMQGVDSDYDILVLTDSRLSYGGQNEIRGVVFDWAIERDAVISMLFRSKEEWNSALSQISPFHREVEKDALAL